MVDINDIKLPPHNIEAEKAIISACLLDNETLYTFDSLSLLPQDFYKKEHISIYQAIKELWSSRRTIDVVTLSNQIEKNKELENIGGNDYLYEISSFLLSTSGSYEYGKIVKEKSVLRSILKVCQWITGEVYEQKDVIDIIDKVEKRIFDLTQFNTTDSIKHIKDILWQRVEEYMEIVDNPLKLEQMKVLSRYEKMDDLLGWFKAWDLVILAARPSMGKTAFALNILANVSIAQKKSVAIFSLEMTSDQIVDRILSMVSQIPMYKMSKGLLDGNDFSQIWEAIEKLWETNIYIDDKGGATIPEIKSKLRRIKVEKGSLDMVIIDYLQLMSSNGSKFAGNRVQEISEISRGLKELAKELWVPIIALSQLSRGTEQRTDKRPQLSDLRESGAIEQDADSVLMLYREDYYDTDTDRKWTADVYIRKNRNGPTGDVEFKFIKEYMKFVETDRKTGND